MKKTILLIMFIGINFGILAQNYTPLNYHFNGTPKHGIKIKTNLPYTNSSQMPTIIIEGYNYGKAQSIGIILNWYIFKGNFVQYTASSHGVYNPPIKLANEGGKVIIYLDSKQYYNRFQVRAYAKGLSADIAKNYQGWTAVDESLKGTNMVTVSYKKNSNQQSAIWTNKGVDISYLKGNVGIGTNTPDEKLAVNGTIHTKEVKVDLKGWPDFVFDKKYKLPSLEDVEKHIKEKGHLKNIPSAKEVAKSGILLGEMNAKLLQKIEELTLYTIQQQYEIEEEKKKNNALEKRLIKLEKLITEEN